MPSDEIPPIAYWALGFALLTVTSAIVIFAFEAFGDPATFGLSAVTLVAVITVPYLLGRVVVGAYDRVIA